MITKIIVEGADQQGKSTLCKFLAEQLGYSVVHFGKPEKGFDFGEDYAIQEKTISDRNFLSERVYSRIRQEKSKVNMPVVKSIFSTDTLVILVDRGENFVFDDSRPEMYSETQIRKAMRFYRDEYDMLRMNKIHFNPNCAGQKYGYDMFDLVKYIQSW